MSWGFTRMTGTPLRPMDDESKMESCPNASGVNPATLTNVGIWFCIAATGVGETKSRIDSPTSDKAITVSIIFV